MLSRWRSFRGLDPAMRALVASAWLWLAVARVWLAVVPFRRVAPRLGRRVEPAHGSAPPAASAAQEEVALAVRHAIGIATRNAPLRAVCFQQAAAAKRMLNARRVPSALFLGAALDAATGAMTAHAWVRVGTVGVTGFPIDPGIVAVARFD